MNIGCGMMVLLACVCLFAAGAGCSRANKEEDKTQPKGKSSAQLMIEGVTGKAAVDAGEKMKADIKDIAERQNAALEEVLEE